MTESANKNDEQEVARLERLNNDLKRSLRRCRDMLHDYELRLTANSNEPERPGDQEQQVRRVAEVNDPETPPPPRFPGQSCFPPERGSILAKKSDQTARFPAEPMPVNLNAFELFLGLRVAAHLRTNHRHFVTRLAQRARFLPYATVERHGQVFDDDEDGRLAHLRLAPGD